MNKRSNHQFFGLAVFSLGLLFLFGVLGCDSGPNTGFVSGKVTIDGEAKEGTVVTFSPKTGERSAIGYTDAKGEYYLRFTQDKKGCIPGMHLVSITAYKDPESEYTQYLPATYNDKASDNPDLNNVEVKKGKQVINFEVKTN